MSDDFMATSLSFTPEISIVICTYNNAESLAITLQQLSAQIVPKPTDVEIILINNNSTDNTQEICTALKSSISIPLHYHFEHKQGLSHARNTGVRQAKGKYILFTDDDATLPNNWVAEYLEKIAKYSADCLYSTIYVIWDKPKPWWYQNEYQACFVELNYGNTVLQVEDIHHEFFGKNFCVKKQLIIDHGGFDPALGRIGTQLIAGEETLLYRNLVRMGRNIIYFPSAPVGHRLKPKEYTVEHISKLFVDGAYSSVHIARLSAIKKIAGRPLGIFVETTKTLIKSLLLLLLYAIKCNKPQILYRKLCVKKSLAILKLWIKKA